MKAPRAAIAQQYALATQVAVAMDRSYLALEEVKSLRAQLKKAQEGSGPGALPKALGNAITVLDKKAEALAGGEAEDQFAALTPGMRESNLSRLNGELGQLLAVVDSADAAPTTQAVRVAGEMQQTLNNLLTRWNSLKEEVAAVSRQFGAAHLPEIKIESAVPAEKQEN